jgi:drug/metabolite transporter (DMT)-like permease
VVAHALTDDEKMTGAKVAALLAGTWRQLACLGAALSYALAGFYGRRFRATGAARRGGRPVTASSVLILPIMLILEPPWTLATLPAATIWAALASLALLSTALAYVLYFRILAASGATNLLLATFLIPVTPILLGTLFLRERLEARHIAGMALIGLGLVAIDGRIARLVCAAK